MQQFVTRVGLKFLFRVSDLISIAEKLEANGFHSRADFLSLSTAKAAEFGITEKLADALKDEAAGPPDYRKVSSVTRLEEKDVDEDDGPRGPGAGLEIYHFAHISAGVPTYETRVEGLTVSHPFHGFPSALRDYEPKSPASPRGLLSPFRGPASPREEPAFCGHVVRQSSARRLRTAQQDELDIGGGRRDLSPDPWKATSFHQSGGSAVMGTSRNRCIAGFETWTKVKHMTSDISPTYVCGVATTPEHHNDYGWGSNDSSPRRYRARLKQGHSGSSPTIPEHSRLPLRKLQLNTEQQAVVIVQPTTPTPSTLSSRLAAWATPHTEGQVTMAETKVKGRTLEDDNMSKRSTVPPTPSERLGVTSEPSGVLSCCSSTLGLVSGAGLNTPRPRFVSPRDSEKTTSSVASGIAMVSPPMKAPAIPSWAVP